MTSPLWPWISIVRDIVERSGNDSAALARHHAAALCEVAPELASSWVDLPELPSLGPEAQLVRVCEALCARLRQVASHGPLVVFVDDLHRADKSSLKVLEFIARSNVEAPLVILGTYRDTENDRREPLVKALASLSTSNRYERLGLDGLSNDEARLLTAGLTDEQADRVVEKSEGNPLFATLLARTLARNPESSAPKGVREAILGNFADVSEQCWKVVSAASVVGRDFADQLVGDVCHMGERDVGALLDEARRAGMATQGPRIVQPSFCKSPVSPRKTR